ncbi:hypothetical protein KY386_00265 [Candidatus Parcubacteria bacterium]|nr:hypothetical protein [Candidatus Parcubacteria bacterium]
MHLFVAYLDPGSGSLIIQVVVGSAAGVIFLFRNSFRQGIQLVKGLLAKSSANSAK